MISNAKRSCNYQKLGINPTTKNLNRTLKTHLAKNQDSFPSKDIKTLNKYFATIGSKLSEALPKGECKYLPATFEKTLVLTKTDENELHKLRKNSRKKTKKSTGDGGISKKFL